MFDRIRHYLLSLHRVACAAVISGCPLIGVAQEFEQRFVHISSEHGLSNSTVECVLQDSRGFMWFATADGLNRYDGYQMTVYRNVPEDTTSLLNNYVLHLFEDSKQRLWVTTSNGINRYDKSGDKFHRYSYDNLPSGMRGGRGRRFIYEDMRGTLWAGTRAGLHVLNEHEGRFEPAATPNGGHRPPFTAEVTCMVEDAGHNLWIGTAEDGLYKRDPQGIFTHFLHDPANPESLSHNSVTDIKIDLHGQLWIGTLRGLNKMVGEQTFVHFTHHGAGAHELSSNVVKCIAVDHVGNVWVGTENGGINVWDIKKQRFLRHENHPWKPHSLSQKTVSSIAEDNQGNMWIGTHRGGVNLYSPQSEKFRLYTQGPTPQDLSYKDVKAFYEAKDGTIYIGTDGGGLNVWNRKQHTFAHYRHRSADQRSIGSDAVLHIMEDSDGDIWLGTWQGGLNKFNPKDGTFVRYVHDVQDASSIGSDNVWQILEDRDKRLWIATENGGLNLFDKRSGRFKRIAGNRQNEPLSATSNIHALAMDGLGRLWLGCSDGALYRYEESGDTFTRYLLHRADSGHASSSAIKVIYSDDNGKLWVGAEGLYLYDPIANRFTVAPCNNVSLQHEMVPAFADFEPVALDYIAKQAITANGRASSQQKEEKDEARKALLKSLRAVASYINNFTDVSSVQLSSGFYPVADPRGIQAPSASTWTRIRQSNRPAEILLEYEPVREAYQYERQLATELDGNGEPVWQPLPPVSDSRGNYFSPVEDGVTYYFRVRSMNKRGVSAWSPVASRKVWVS